MKRISYKTIVFLVSVLTLMGCNDTMDDKADIDGKYTKKFDTPVFGISEIKDVTHNSAVVTLNLSAPENVVEQGIQVSSSSDFTEYENYWVEGDAVADGAEVDLNGGLEPETTYYIRPYIFTVNEETVYGTATTFTTGEAPARIPAYIGNYTYTILEDLAGYVDEDLTLNILATDNSMFKIEHWGYDVDFIFKMDEKGELSAEPQPFGTDYYDYGPIYICTANNYWSKDSYDPETDVSYYDSSTGTFNLNLVYFVSAGYINYGVETFQLTGKAESKQRLDVSKKSIPVTFSKNIKIKPQTKR